MRRGFAIFFQIFAIFSWLNHLGMVSPFRHTGTSPFRVLAMLPTDAGTATTVPRTFLTRTFCLAFRMTVFENVVSIPLSLHFVLGRSGRLAITFPFILRFWSIWLITILLLVFVSTMILN